MNIRKIIITFFAAFGCTWVVGLTIIFAIYFSTRNTNIISDEAVFEKIVSSIKSEYSTSLTDLYLGDLAFDEGDIVSEDEIGIERFENEEVEYELSLSEIKKFEGKIKVDVLVSYRDLSHELSIQVLNFMSELSYLRRETNEMLATVGTTYHTQIDLHIDDAPQIAENWTTLGLQKPSLIKSGFTSTMALSSKDQAKGVANYTLRLSKEMTNKELYISEDTAELVINGFQTSNIDLNELNKEMRTLPDSYQTSIEDRKPTELISSGQTINSSSNLGFIINIANPAITYTLAIQETDDITGEIRMRLNLTLNNESVSKEIKATGFMSNDKFDVETVYSKFSAMDTSLRVLPSTIGTTETVVSAAELGVAITFDLLNTNISYEIETIDDNGGWLVANVTINKGSHTKIKKIQISGYLTTSEAAMISVMSKISDKTTTKIHDYPTDVVKNLKESAATLGISEPEDKEGTTITYELSNLNDANGTMKALVTVSIGSFTPLTKIITISGYRSTVNDTKDVDALLAKFVGTSTSKTTVNASSVGNIGSTVTLTTLGISPTLPTNSAQYSLAIKAIDDVEGSVNITATVTSGKITKNKDFVVSGFIKQPIVSPPINGLRFTAGNAVSSNNNLRINRSYWGAKSMDIDFSGYPHNTQVTGYVVELTNGVSFMFGTPSYGNFFSGYGFDAGNSEEDAQASIKARLYEFVNDTISYMNFGISQDVDYWVTIFGEASGLGEIAATSTPNKDVKQIHLNYNYNTLRTYEDKSTSSTWSPGFREYSNAITLIIHELGHLESEFAIGLFNDDNETKWPFKEEGLNFNENWREYDGVSAASKFVDVFNGVGVDISSIFNNLYDNNGQYQSSSNSGYTGVRPSAPEFYSMISHMFGEDAQSAIGDLYDDSKYRPILNKFDFSGSNINFNSWDYNLDGSRDSSVTFQNGKDWFVNNAIVEYMTRHYPFIAPSTYVFNFHEFMTRMLMLLTQKGLRNGATWFAESIWSSMGNLLNASQLSISNSNSAKQNANSFINNQSSIRSNYGMDAMAQEYFNFGTRLGYSNLIKILENRETVLDGFLKVLYGGLNRNSFGMGQHAYATGNMLDQTWHWNLLWLIGTTTTKNVVVKWKRRRETSWQTFTVPQSAYKPIIYRLGGEDIISSNFYYYNIDVPLKMIINDKTAQTPYFTSGNVSDEDIVIAFENSTPVLDIAFFSPYYNSSPNKRFYTSPQQAPPVISGRAAIIVLPVTVDANDPSQIVLQYAIKRG